MPPHQVAALLGLQVHESTGSGREFIQQSSVAAAHLHRDDFQTRLANMLRAHAGRNGQTVGIYDGDLTKIKLADSPTTNA